MRTNLMVALASAALALGCKKNEAQQPPAPKPTAPDPAGKDKPAPKPTVPAGLDTANIEKLTGAKGKLSDKEGVFKVSVPRKDLSVTIAEHVKMTPPMGLTAWAAFQKMGDHTMVMGDIVMTEDQVDHVCQELLTILQQEAVPHV